MGRKQRGYQVSGGDLAAGLDWLHAISFRRAPDAGDDAVDALARAVDSAIAAGEPGPVAAGRVDTGGLHHRVQPGIELHVGVACRALLGNVSGLDALARIILRARRTSENE